MKNDVATVTAALRADFLAFELRFNRRLNRVVLQLAVIQIIVGGLIVAAVKLLP